MSIFTTRESYIQEFQQALEETDRETKELKVYVDERIQQLDLLLEDMSKETFWQIWPEILGIDAKLVLVTELINFEDFSNDEIIRMTETDYRMYLKELFGHNISEETKHSLLFNLL